VIDMLNEFCKPGGAMILPGCERLVPPQTRVLDAARRAGSTILFVVDTHRPNVRQDREFLKRAPHCLEESWGARVIEDLDPRPEDVYVVKRRYSAFFGTDLDLTLRDLQINTLVIVGVVTNICVRSTVHDAAAGTAALGLGLPLIVRAADPIKVGVLQPLSGGLENLGQQGVQGTQLAIEEANDAGGVLGRRLDLVIADDKTDPKTAVER